MSRDEFRERHPFVWTAKDQATWMTEEGLRSQIRALEVPAMTDAAAAEQLEVYSRELGRREASAA